MLVNRVGWDSDADNWVQPGRESWASEQITWGAWSVPESDLRVLPDVDGLDAIELGCGTAYWSAWLARRGARPVGLDNSRRQLATARMLQDEFDLHFPLVHADGERPPFRDGSFDLAFSEYGAAIWCDPYAWIPEAARLLRPGGWLIFLGGHPLLLLCCPADDDAAPVEFRLHRDFFGMHRTEWHDENGVVDGVEFRPPTRRDDPPAASLRLRDRGPDRDAGARGRLDTTHRRGHRAAGVGAALPARADLEGPQAVGGHARGFTRSIRADGTVGSWRR